MGRGAPEERRRGKLLPFPGGARKDERTDFELLAAVRSGDNGALRDLFYRHGNRVHRILLLDCGVEARRVSRAVRDTFLLIWRSASQFDARCSVAAWIVRAAMRVGSLGSSSYRIATDGDLLAESIPGFARRAFDDDRTPQVLTTLEERVAALPRGPRMAAVLLEREMMTEVEVSESLAVSPRVVWRWVSEARRALAPLAFKRRKLHRLARWVRAVRRGRLCPPAWKLDCAISTELIPRVGWHMSACISCAREYAILRGVSERLAFLPRHEMSDSVRDAVAVSLLTAPLR
jgi:DNA-directed RNA polymerase specialized sigma24 family protein